MNKKLLALYGLKYNPFSTDVPVEALLATGRVEDFCWKIEHSHLREGGFAFVTGDPGLGKSAAMRILAERLGALREVTVGAVEHPQSNVADFYRELGEVFGVQLRPHNRWAGFRSLRERWIAHIESTLMRPLLLIDEAQEMSPTVLSELRVLSSTRFDSKIILGVVLGGDARLQERLRREELLALGSRMRTRLTLEHATRDELLACLRHRLKAAGNPTLMTAELMNTICEHALGNYRVMINIAADLLAAAARREQPQLDEKLYLEVFAPPEPPPRGETQPSRGRRR
jgi:type II secretory pathway predicted ATPase ExeA